MSDNQRIARLNNDSNRQQGKYILYWMQQSQRAHYNHALEHAVKLGNANSLPVAVFFGIMDNYPGANLRHYDFMVRGLTEVANDLAERDIGFYIQHTSPEKGAVKLAKDAHTVVCDAGFLRHQQNWHHHLAQNAGCPVLQVQTDTVVPIEQAYEKESYTAGTLRPKISKRIDEFLTGIRQEKVKVKSTGMNIDSLDISNPDNILKKLKIDRSVKPVSCPKPGSEAAKRQLKKFIRDKLDDYPEMRNDPSLDGQSGLSPYLHFGQVSPVYIAMEVKKANSSGADAFLEEMIVRRELAWNFVYYNSQYDNPNCLPDWARNSLRLHAKDKREYNYTFQQLEKAKTHDEYWNTAQREMLTSGKMHGYMRMYWGKKVIEWSGSWQKAWDNLVRLNDKYELDGRDPNAYAGIAWCFGKHDRAWPERKVFGKVRYMNAHGLERKFDMDTYIEKVARLEK